MSNILIITTLNFSCHNLGSRFVTTKSIEVEEEGKILSDYLSHCTLDNHHLNLPSDDIPLPDGFQCLFYRAAQEDSYSYEEDEDKEEVEVDEGFTIIFLDENGWDSDTSEKRSQKQVWYSNHFRYFYLNLEIILKCFDD